MLLDLFCGAGGCSKGYQEAGFAVVGVDIRPQPNYCGDEFARGDALMALAELAEFGHWDGGTRIYRLTEFDGIHASPPCQFGASMQSVAKNAAAHKNLIPEVRELLEATGLPYVIENVVGARKHLHRPFMLCGSMFGLGTLRAGVYKQLRRHRLFETNWWPGLLPQCRHERGKAIGIYGDHLRFGRRSSDGELSGPEALAIGKEAMGIDWDVTWRELKEAIPPAYTAWIGEQLMDHLFEVVHRDESAA